MLQLKIMLVGCLAVTNVTHGMFSALVKPFSVISSQDNFIRCMATLSRDKVARCRKQIQYLRNEMNHEHWLFHIDPLPWQSRSRDEKHYNERMAQLKRKLSKEYAKLKAHKEAAVK